MRDDLNQQLEAFIQRVNLVLILDHGGRAGSNFFQCLFDAHQELLICPLVHYLYSYWRSSFGELSVVEGRKAHEFIAHTSYFRLLYQNPEAGVGNLIYKIGGDPHAPFDRARFRSLIDHFLLHTRMMSRKEIILKSYAAYAVCRGFDLSKVKYIGVNDAVSERNENIFSGYSLKLLDTAATDFPDVFVLALLRDPRAQYASTRHQMVNELGNNYGLNSCNYFRVLHQILFNKIDLDNGPAHLCFLYQIAAFRALIKKWQQANSQKLSRQQWHFLKNEDFNLDFVLTMLSVCQALRISPDPEWIEKGDDYKAKMMGVPWHGTGAYNSRYQSVVDGPLKNDAQEAIQKALGPSRYVTQRWKDKLSFFEKFSLEIFFLEEITILGYERIFNNSKFKNLQLLMYQLWPWSGEVPSSSWVLEGKSNNERIKRASYYIVLWPLYVLCRLKIYRWILSGVFKATSQDIQVPLIKPIKME
ncbi:MAG: hypothetical protein L6Q57_06495 [Alphaproteobacteria bacterium]|nr:hypothetical protein [Alphaproteobacteria bacterium]